MDITPVIPQGKYVIEGHGIGYFTINDKRYEGSQIVFPEVVIPWPPTSSEALTESDFAPILERKDEIEILLIGSGDSFMPLPPAIKSFCKDAGIAVDMMDTGAACRTYNILLAEERPIAAALIARKS